MKLKRHLLTEEEASDINSLTHTTQVWNPSLETTGHTLAHEIAATHMMVGWVTTQLMVRRSGSHRSGAGLVALCPLPWEERILRKVKYWWLLVSKTIQSSPFPDRNAVIQKNWQVTICLHLKWLGLSIDFLFVATSLPANTIILVSVHLHFWCMWSCTCLEYK